MMARLSTGEVTPIRWYQARSGARVLPLTTAFGSPTWELRPDHFPGPGVYLRGAEWAPRVFPAPPGIHYHGRPEWYLDGVPRCALHPGPVDELCGVPVAEGRGGAALGGTGWPLAIASRQCDCDRLVVATSAPQTVDAVQCDCDRLVAATSAPQTVDAVQCDCDDLVVDLVRAVELDAVQCDCTADSAALVPLVSLDLVECDCDDLVVDLVPALGLDLAQCDCDREELDLVPALGLDLVQCDCDREDAAVALGLDLVQCDCDREDAAVAPPPPPFTTAALGTASVTSATTISIPGITLQAGECLVVGAGLSAPTFPTSVTWGGIGPDVDTSMGGPENGIWIWYSPGAGTHTLTLSWGTACDCAVFAIGVVPASGPITTWQLVHGDRSFSPTTAVSTGSPAPVSTVPSYAVCCLVVLGPGTDGPPAWTSPATGTSHIGTSLVSVADGQATVTATGVFALSAVLPTARNWSTTYFSLIT